MRKLTEWINTNYGKLYHRVDEQLNTRAVTPETMVFLFRRGDAVVQTSKPGHEESTLNGVIVDGYPSSPLTKSEDSTSPWAKRSKPGRTKRVWKWTIPVWSYKYDGTFFKDQRYMDIEIEADKSDEKVPINTLSAYPMRYATEKTQNLLERRGAIFWTCRNQRLISYEDVRGIYGVSFHLAATIQCSQNADSMHQTAERFVVDFQTYIQLHSTDYAFKREYKSIEYVKVVRMGPHVMDASDPPPGPELYAFPAQLVAYNLRS